MEKPKICDLLGVDVDEPFQFVDPEADRCDTYMVNTYGDIVDTCGEWISAPDIYNVLAAINGKMEIKRLQQWGKEQQILKAALTLGYRYIARNQYGVLGLYTEQPGRYKGVWDSPFYACLDLEGLFPTVTWEDGPLDIKEML